MKLTANQIKAIEQAGAKRWTKGGHDRLYIKATSLGLHCEYYKSGNVSSATWLGKGISNSDARRILGASVYVDAADGEIVISGTRWADDLRVQAEAFVAEALADLPEVGPVEAAETYESAIEALAEGVVGREYTSAAYYVAVCGICEQFDRSWHDANRSVLEIVRAVSGAKRMPFA